jgi:hypothetical protein
MVATARRERGGADSSLADVWRDVQRAITSEDGEIGTPEMPDSSQQDA